MIVSTLALQVVSQTFTGEHVIRDTGIAEANLSLPVELKAEDIHRWKDFTSGNWYALEMDCLRRADGGLICKNTQREDDEK